MATMDEQVVRYLTDAHGMEQQSLKSLESSASSADTPSMKALFEQHIEQTKTQQARLERRLREIGAEPSTTKDAGNAAISAGKGLVDRFRPDNAGKNVRDAYIGESLEIVSYELLSRVARRAGDEQTVEVAEQNLSEERATLEQLEGLLDEAVDASLREEGVAAA